MTRWRRTTACERGAQWISLDLDGELSRLEQTALARHLATQPTKGLARIKQALDEAPTSSLGAQLDLEVLAQDRPGRGDH